MTNADSSTLSLPVRIGKWRAVYWEPVPGTGERLCIGCLTDWDGVVHSHRFIRQDLLTAMYGAQAERAGQLIDKALRNSLFLAKARGIDSDASPIGTIAFGEPNVLHANSEGEVVRAALLMASSLGTLSEPASLQAEDVAADGTQVNRQFITRVRDEVATVRPDLIGYFNRETTLKSKNSTVKFGFLSDRLVAHLGLLQVSRLAHYVRNARGLMAEVNLAHHARGGAGAACLILGIPPLSSPTLTIKERSSLEAASEELRLECEEYDVEYAAAESDIESAKKLISLA